MRPRTLQRMTWSTRNSPRSTTTKTRSLLNSGDGEDDPHAKERRSRLDGWGLFFVRLGTASFKDAFSGADDELLADLTDVHQAVLLRNPRSRSERGRLQAQVGIPQARDEMASRPQSGRCQ